LTAVAVAYAEREKMAEDLRDLRARAAGLKNQLHAAYVRHDDARTEAAGVIGQEVSADDVAVDENGLEAYAHQGDGTYTRVVAGGLCSPVVLPEAT
jgi:hypothetical protein